MSGEMWHGLRLSIGGFYLLLAGGTWDSGYLWLLWMFFGWFFVFWDYVAAPGTKGQKKNSKKEQS